MKKILFVCLLFVGVFTLNAGTGGGKNFPSLLTGSNQSPELSSIADSIYYTIHLDSFGLNRDAFFYAYKGYQFLSAQNKLNNKNVLTICDYSQSSHNRRLYIIDLAAGKILFNTFVSHGKRSGEEYAWTFSNTTNSNKSSLGFLVTGETYKGKAGYSMHFDGVEPGINDKVRKRDIVMHGSWYVNEQRADEGGYMGRSLGCPAVPYKEHKQIIDLIKGGSCFFVYHPDSWYAQTSQILNARVDWPVASTQTNVQGLQQPAGN